MTEKLYTIGEISKLTNLSIQTLRYYDKIDLLKPAHVDTLTNYRYYKDTQLYFIDIIKSLKYIGTPLEDIKHAQNFSTEQLVDFLKVQEAIVEEKVKRMQEVQYILMKTTKQLEDQLNIPVFNEVYETTEKPKRLLSVKTKNLKITESPEEYIRVLTQIIEQEGSVAAIRYGGIYGLENYEQLTDICYHSICTPLLSDKYIQHLGTDVEVITMPAGKYVSIAFYFNEQNYYERYKQLYEYIMNSHSCVETDVYEFFMPLKYTSNEDPSFIIELKVKLL